MIEELMELWGKDSKIDKSSLDNESLKISELHNKYFKIYLKISKRKRIQKADYYKLLNLKKRYYLGTMDKQEIEEKGWVPFNLKVAQTQLQPYLDSDQDLVKMSLELGEIDDQIEFCKSILDMVIKRGFQINNAIDFIKFQNGLS